MIGYPPLSTGPPSLPAPTCVLPQIRLRRRSGDPLHDQLVRSLRRLIVDGELPPGTRLPPTRRAAEALEVSRNVVVLAYEQLQLEGYLTARVGAGTWVPSSLPTHLLPPRQTDGRSGTVRPPAAHLSGRGERIVGAGREARFDEGPPRVFRPGAVAADLFPARLWARMATRVWQRNGPSMVPYGDPLGYGPLRERIADHLVRHRAVRCEADQIVVTHGSQQALDLIVRMLQDPGERVAVEDPAYPGFRAAATAAGVERVPVPVDGDGLDVGLLEERARDVRMVYATPSHQYPLGVTLPLERRLRLLEWARSADARVVEDDYDSEFRYESRPLPSLQGLDEDGLVIYVGTFSKVLAPALRLGFVVLPPSLVESFGRAVTAVPCPPATSIQATLAGFMAEGHLERHIHRLRGIYGTRWEALRAALREHLEGRVEVLPGAAGLHLTVLVDEGTDDRELSRRAHERGLDAPALSGYYATDGGRPGLLLGFGGSPPERLRRGVGILAELLESGGDDEPGRRDRGRPPAGPREG